MFERRSLAELSTNITDGSHFSPTPQEEGELIANVKDMKGGRIDFESCTRISPLAYRELMATGCVIEKGDVLLSKDGTVGRVVVYREDRKIGALSSIALIKAETLLAAPSFLGQFLQSTDARRQFDNAMSGSALRRLVLRDIRDLQIATPPRDEQVKIAQILDTLDTQIRQTEALIAKLERIKQGLLTDLLTRGIDENGQLRPTPDRAPQLYKDSPLGRIPKEWDAVPLDQLAENLDGKRVPIKKAVRKSGIYPYYGASGVIDWVDEYIFDGDYILLGEDGENVVSRKLPLAFRATGRIWVNNHAHIYQPRPCTDIRFLLMVLEEKDYSKWVLGSAQPKLTQKAISFIRFSKPSFQEQALIADMVGALDERTDAERKVLRKLGIKKLGVMDDLLTGRVRVTPLLAANQQAIA